MNPMWKNLVELIEWTGNWNFKKSNGLLYNQAQSSDAIYTNNLLVSGPLLDAIFAVEEKKVFEMEIKMAFQGFLRLNHWTQLTDLTEVKWSCWSDSLLSCQIQLKTETENIMRMPAMPAFKNINKRVEQNFESKSQSSFGPSVFTFLSTIQNLV